MLREDASMHLLSEFVSTYVGQVSGYFAAVSVVTAVVWWWGSDRLATRRIRAKGRGVDARQIRHEVGHTLGVMAVGTLQALAVQALAAAGWTSFTEGAGPLVTVAWVVALLLGNDLWFYLGHRALHTPWLFKHVHAVHHRSVDVNPFTSYSFHVLEPLVVTGWVVPVAIFLPVPLPALAAAQFLGFLNNVMSHLGYELLPAWWVRAPLLRWTNSATFHSLHHTRFKGNYGLVTRLWDRLFGTELDGYEAAFEAAHPPAEPATPRTADPR